MAANYLLAFPNGRDRVKTIHHRHLNIHQHQIKTLPAKSIQPIKSLQSIVSYCHLMAGFFQKSSCHLLVTGLSSTSRMHSGEISISVVLACVA